jgi:small subunit ribosomal protein S1
MVKETENKQNENQNGGAVTESFEELLAQHDQLEEVRRGELVTGVVVGISNGDIFVDIGSKVEGILPVSDFEEMGVNIPEVGEEVEAVVDRTMSGGDVIRLSYKKAKQRAVADQLQEAASEKTPVKGKIIEKIKGGFTVDLGGVKAFLPQSHVDIKKPKKAEHYIGNEYEFVIVKPSFKNYVVSRKELLEEEYTAKKEERLASLKEGDLVKGQIKNITDYGVFVDLDGIDGLLHISDISWGKVTHPSDFFKVNDEIEVLVLSIDKETEKISLGYKQKSEDPWTKVEEKYPVGTKVNAKVVNIKNYGAFVEVEPGIEGLIHVNDMSWTQKISKAQQFLKVNEEVEAVVLEVSGENKKLALGLKQIKDNPWEVIQTKFKEGDEIEGEIKNVTEFGAFVEIYDGVDGLIHVTDMSWSKKTKNPADFVKTGDKVKVKILSIDTEKQRVSLGMKQLEEDPWKAFFKKHSMGDTVKGKIVRLESYGAFVELEGEVEGLVHVSEIAKERIDKPSDVLQEGQEVEMKIVKIDSVDRKIGLSIRQLIIAKEKEEYEKTRAESKPVKKTEASSASKPKTKSKPKAQKEQKDSESTGGATLGDIMKDFLN